MTTILDIRNYVATLPSGKMFSTFDLLHLGSRASVDQSVNRMVQKREIMRLAPGQFMKLEIGLRIPSRFEIELHRAVMVTTRRHYRRLARERQKPLA